MVSEDIAVLPVLQVLHIEGRFLEGIVLFTTGNVVTNPDGTILQSVEYIKLGFAIRTDGDIYLALAETWVIYKIDILQKFT